MHEPLKNCPFCGGINIIHCGHHMYCHACGADGPDADSQHESEARSAWNRRTPQPVAREPLTDGQIAEMMRETWGRASIAPRHALEFARAVERAHGIAQKGGS
jgi:hypothetical protein